LDWIPCPEGRTKAVVACMANCRRKCDQFWKFFEKLGKSPREYYNRDNVGEDVMRRVVFDCDRCGRKDVSPIYSRYDETSYPEDKVLDRDTQAGLLENTDYLYNEIGSSFFQIVHILEQETGWRHFCDKCFLKVLSSWAGILAIKKRGGDIDSDDMDEEDATEGEMPKLQEKPVPDIVKKRGRKPKTAA
jgi:hypothetical protein